MPTVPKAMAKVRLNTYAEYAWPRALGKFAHGIFRSAALLKYAIEKRQANPINTGSD
ncbi:hypothetical protein HX776_21155 [Pseudomonas agarici]|uniref:hypothetical protein n=1 Tax=Pseudomonas agarici TaxID=46677 RepID=UPI0002ED4005|nr:hypothetical protein [Pseudomonas agarici]NWC11307.1 hypothetical protein [Pseudomonas agarici]SEL43974.1 hypothetical protein SAMN05216604_11889 [Pseudomonas agarici]